MNTTNSATGALADPPQPLVTVLTPTYNRRTMLADTLASVRLQDYPRIEHIVIDGGSSDGTLDLLREAEERWGVRWMSASDNGMYEALNTGLGMATGDIVGWVNSDDWLMPWTVSTVVTEMARRPYQHAVFGDYLSIQPGNPNARIRVYGQFNRRGLASVETLAQPTVFWPTAATVTVGQLNTDTYRQIADCEYWLRLSETVPFFKIREFLALGQDHPGTKRESRASEIASEFMQLRAQYRVSRPTRRLQRFLSAVRWRREWGSLLWGRGWPSTRHSGLVVFPWREGQMLRTTVRFGPQRRHPPHLVRASVAPLMRRLAEVRAELGPGSSDHKSD
jgi:glycosyltransferase involved in cell wall biosynthesis